MEETVRTEMKIVEEPKRPISMHPKKFAMWLFMASVMMLFASLTSAYIVREAEGNWLYFELPSLFYWTTGIIVLSSVTIQVAYFAVKRNRDLFVKAEKLSLENRDSNEIKEVLKGIQQGKVKTLMLATTLLGIVFLIGQFLAWGALVSNSIYFIGNPSGSFLYVLTGLHGMHIISAVIFLLVVLYAVASVKSNEVSPLDQGASLEESRPYQNMAQMEMCTTYWHFLGALWVYLFIFLIINR